MEIKSLEDRIQSFEEQYKQAFQCFDQEQFEDFLSKIRIAIERLAKLIIADICSPEDVYTLQEGNPITLSNGLVYDPCANKTRTKQVGGAFIIHAQKIIYPLYHGTKDDSIVHNIQNVIMQLYTFYSIASLTHHDDEEDKYSVSIQAAACLFTIASLFDIMKDVLSYQSFNSLPQSDFLEKENNSAKGINSFLELDDLNVFTNNFDADFKYILLSPQNLPFASKTEGASSNFYEDIFGVHWAMVLDYETSESTGLYNFIPDNIKNSISVNKGVVTDISDGSTMTNWIFAKGQNIDPASLIKTKKQERSQLKYLSDAISSMLSKGSLSDVVFVSLFMPVKDVTRLLNNLFIEIEGLAERSRIVSLSTNSSYDYDSFLEENEIPKECFLEVTASFDLFLRNIRNLKPDFKNHDIATNLLRINHGFFDYNKYAKTYEQAGLEILSEYAKDTNINPLGTFYKGEIIQWKELENDYDVKREKYNIIFDAVRNMLKKLQITECVIYSKPGSGSTTLARRIGYEVFKRSSQSLERACIVVFLKKYDRMTTCQRIESLSEQSGNTKILLIAESEVITQKQLNVMIEQLQQGEKNITVLYISTSSNLKAASVDKTENKFLLEEFLNKSERDLFLHKFKSLAQMDEKTIEALKDKKQIEVLDFPLMLATDDVSDNLLPYVSTWLEALPDRIKKFCGYIAFCSFFSGGLYINERLFRIVISDSQFTLPLKHLLSADEKRALDKLLITDYDLEGTPLPFWKPRYYPFSRFILKSIWPDWKNRVHEIAKDVIKIVSSYGRLEEDDMSMLYSLFLERRDADFRDDTNKPLLNKFSDLIQSIQSIDRAESVLELLKITFPEDPYFAAHYARFLFEKARENKDITPEDIAYSRALENINCALALNPNSDELYHIKGMFYRRRIESLYNEYKKQGIDNKTATNSLLNWMQEAKEAFDFSIEMSVFSAYGYVAKGQLYKQTIDNYKEYSGKSENDFLEEDEVFIELREDFGQTIESLNSICDQYGPTKNSDRPEYLARTVSMYEQLRLYYSLLVGCDTYTVDKYRRKLRSANSENISMYRQLFCDALLYSKLGNRKYIKQAYKNLTSAEYEELSQVLDDRRNAGDVYAFEKIFNLKLNSLERFDLDDTIDLLHNWESSCNSQKNAGYLLLRVKFLLASAYAIKALNANAMDVYSTKKSDDYFEESRSIAHSMGRTPYGSQLTPIFFLGKENDIHSFVDRYEDVSERRLVTGTIIDITKTGKGWMRLSSGQKVSFKAESYDPTLDISKQISGYLGFRYQGLGLYQTKSLEVIDQEETMKEIHEEIKAVEQQYAHAVEQDKEANIIKASDEAKKIMQSPKILGKVEMPILPSKNRTLKKLVKGELYEGVVVAEGNNILKIQTEHFPHPLEIRFKDCEVYEDDKVSFRADCEPNHGDNSKMYWFACDIQLINEK